MTSILKTIVCSIGELLLYLTLALLLLGGGILIAGYYAFFLILGGMIALIILGAIYDALFKKK